MNDPIFWGMAAVCGLGIFLCIKAKNEEERKLSYIPLGIGILGMVFVYALHTLCSQNPRQVPSTTTTGTTTTVRPDDNTDLDWPATTQTAAITTVPTPTSKLRLTHGRIVSGYGTGTATVIIDGKPTQLQLTGGIGGTDHLELPSTGSTTTRTSSTSVKPDKPQKTGRPATTKPVKATTRILEQQ